MIYILLPVHNRIEETTKFVSCLNKQTHKNFHLILIDDGSEDGTAEFVSREIKHHTILHGKGSLWWAGSLDKGSKYLLSMKSLQDEDIVLIANDDTIFDEHYLEAVHRESQNNPKALILSKCYNQTTGDILDHGVHVDWKNFRFQLASTPDHINVLSTRGLFMRVAIFKNISRFHPVLLPHYFSDYAFTHRAFRKGYRLTVSENAKVYLNDTTTGIKDVDYNVGLSELCKNLFFSKKSNYNVLYNTSLVLLSSDYRYIPKNLFRIQKRTIWTLYRWLSTYAKKRIHRE